MLASTASGLLAGAVAASAPSGPASNVVNGLAARLQAALSAQQVDANSNVVFSPASIGIAMTMTSAGAAGDTLEEMNEVLGITGPEIHDSMGALSSALTDGTDGSFTLANSLWVQDGFAIEDSFATRLADSYHSEAFREDFAGDPAGAVEDINGWVAEATSDRISDLLSETDVDPLTRLVLANAVYLDAEWRSPFSPDATQPDQFTRGDGSTVETDFMHQTLHAAFGDTDGLQVVVLPYTNGYEMVVVLPPDGGLHEFEEVLAEAGDLDSAVGDLVEREVVLSVPTWDFDTRTDLVEALEALGMTLAFDIDRADFTGISTEEPLAIGGVIHQADITVDEAGTEAAAATAVIAVAGAAPPASEPPPVEMDVDRPF